MSQSKSSTNNTLGNTVIPMVILTALFFILGFPIDLLLLIVTVMIKIVMVLYNCYRDVLFLLKKQNIFKGLQSL